MGKVNLSRVIMGGLLAGLIINVSEFLLNDKVMKTVWEAQLKTLGKTMPEDAGAMTFWIVDGFVTGIVAVWLYAAIRPRYGPGPGTAARAGLVVWFFTCLLWALAMQNLGLFPVSVLALVWVLVESIVATIAGAWLYKEA